MFTYRRKEQAEGAWMDLGLISIKNQQNLQWLKERHPYSLRSPHDAKC